MFLDVNFPGVGGALLVFASSLANRLHWNGGASTYAQLSISLYTPSVSSNFFLRQGERSPTFILRARRARPMLTLPIFVLNYDIQSPRPGAPQPSASPFRGYASAPSACSPRVYAKRGPSSEGAGGDFSRMTLTRISPLKQTSPRALMSSG